MNQVVSWLDNRWKREECRDAPRHHRAAWQQAAVAVVVAAVAAAPSFRPVHHSIIRRAPSPAADRVPKQPTASFPPPPVPILPATTHRTTQISTNGRLTSKPMWHPPQYVISKKQNKKNRTRKKKLVDLFSMNANNRSFDQLSVIS